MTFHVEAGLHLRDGVDHVFAPQQGKLRFEHVVADGHVLTVGPVRPDTHELLTVLSKHPALAFGQPVGSNRLIRSLGLMDFLDVLGSAAAQRQRRRRRLFGLERWDEFGFQRHDSGLVDRLCRCQSCLFEPIGVVCNIHAHGLDAPWLVRDDSAAHVDLLLQKWLVVAKVDVLLVDTMWVVGVPVEGLVVIPVAQVRHLEADLGVVVCHRELHLLGFVGNDANAPHSLVRLSRQQLARGVWAHLGVRHVHGRVGRDDFVEARARHDVHHYQFVVHGIESRAIGLDDSRAVEHGLGDDLLNFTLGILHMVEVRLAPKAVNCAVVFLAPHLPGDRHARLARHHGVLGADQRVRVVGVGSHQVWLTQAVVDHKVAHQVVGGANIHSAGCGSVYPEEELLRRTAG
mmetsp:Transcript_42997/g.69159  ORF Transcript_42997/g.69159 Transcript_42997/m.69159 type:complete len:401 (-) Transcript_42997:1723-2925(-)